MAEWLNTVFNNEKNSSINRIRERNKQKEYQTGRKITCRGYLDKYDNIIKYIIINFIYITLLC